MPETSLVEGSSLWRRPPKSGQLSEPICSASACRGIHPVQGLGRCGMLTRHAGSAPVGQPWVLAVERPREHTWKCMMFCRLRSSRIAFSMLLPCMACCCCTSCCAISLTALLTSTARAASASWCRISSVLSLSSSAGQTGSSQNQRHKAAAISQQGGLSLLLEVLVHAELGLICRETGHVSACM